jgi:hypothetical protein
VLISATSLVIVVVDYTSLPFDRVLLEID